ncbi:sodium-coupled monocarboxylate transporter 1-like [Gigantopelta aegis]|uniref:sodium-coupled monocarboxylate transporter 1-like n=1 Tax=Gigantopelta aegis TaxID=1735272 RepID=UPI001B888398|nr:sodium-coupled monocarboxylate transporter 1-like [Gigantopelta aegis]
MAYSFETGRINQLSTWDYVIFALILIVSAGIGIFYAIKDRNRKSIQEFLMAGRNMSVAPVALSLVASFMSAITLLGSPAEMYNYSTMFWWIGLSYVFVAYGAAHIYIPIFYNLRVTSLYEYLERRFCKGVRTMGSIAFSLQMLLYMAIVLYAPSLALNAVTGFSLWGSVISVGVVCTIYTTLGGMKAVLWTDTFQIGMMYAGLLAVLIKGAMTVGGVGKAWEIAAENKRIYFTDFSMDPARRHSVWSLAIGGYFTWVAIYGTNQAQVQRACACPTLKTAQRAIWWNVVGLWMVLYLSCMIGIIMYAFYTHCDPLSFQLISATDQLLPLFVMDVLGPVTGMPGIFIASIFSGALSTISSGLNSLAAVFLEDVIKAYYGKEISQARATNIAKILALIYGLICLGLTYVASLLGNVLQAALSLFGMIAGPLLGLFSLGMFFPWANKWGAYSGLLSGLGFLFWIGIGAQISKPPVYPPKAPLSVTGCNWNVTTTMATTASLNSTVNAMTSAYVTSMANYTTVAPERSADYTLYTLSYMWYSATAFLWVIVVGMIVSGFTGFTDPKTIDPKVICPLADVVFPLYFLPESIRKPLRFGIVHEGKYDKEDTFFKKDLQNGIPVKDDLDSIPGRIKTKDEEANITASAHDLTHSANENKGGVDNSAFFVSPETITTKI